MKLNGLKLLISVCLFLSYYDSGFSQCPTIAPTGIDSCRIGTGTVEIGASGSSGVYSWYDAALGGNFLGNGTPFTTPSISSTTNYFVAAKEVNTGLDFDGTNDYVAIDNYFYNTSGMTELTVEAWVNTTSTANQMICSFDRSEFFRLSINDYAGPGEVNWSVRTNTGIADLQGNTAINDGEWHHVAGVFDNGTLRIYVDGVLDATMTQGTTWGRNVTRYGFIGTGSEASSFDGSKGPTTEMNGLIDEVRVWSVARSQAELSGNMNNCLTGAEAGLQLYYTFEDGTGSSTLSDQVGSADGTLTNMNTATDWVDDEFTFFCPTCESARTTVVAGVSPGTPVDLGPDQQLSCSPTITLDAGAGYTNYLWSTTETTQTIDVSVTGTYWVLVDDGANCYSSDTIIIDGQGGSSQNRLNFDGSNDYIAIDDFFYNSTGLTEVTVEAWIQTTDGGNQIIASYDRSEYWRFGVNGNGAGTGQVCWNVRTNLGIFDFGSSTRIDDGLWHHVAGVFDNGTLSIYIDGVLDATTTNGSTFGTGVTRYGFISSGSEATSFNGGRTPANEVDGNLDEVRIWSIARTQAQIRQDMCKSNVTDNTGLEQYWDLNEGSGTAVTEKENGYNGTMFNMTAGDWSTSGAPIGDESTFLYPGSWTGQTVNLVSCSGDEITISNVSGSPSGLHVYVVEGDPNSTTGITNLTSGNHFYGVFQTDDNAESYDVSYDYTNHPLLPAQSENSAILMDRADNSVSTWTDNGSTVNSTTDELLGNRTGRQELLLDYAEYVWDGSSGTDWGTALNWTPASVPPSGAHIRIPDVTNQPNLDIDRQVGSVVLESGATANLVGNNLSVARDFVHDGLLSSTGSPGTLTLNGTNGNQRFFANSDYTADNIVVNNSDEVSIENGEIYLEASLDISAGTFNTNDSLIVVSNSLGTGRIGEILGTGITGEISMERYIDAGETYWRYFSSAVVGATLAQYNDDFITAGYPGSWFPAFGWNSIYTYDEPSQAYVPATSSAQVIGVGQGLQVWCGDTITGTLPFTVDLRGVPNQGAISLPVSFNFTGTPGVDGFCMVGNPYASTIDWDAAGWTKTSMANATYIQDPDTEMYATYIAGAGANGGSRYIASQQSFWVEALADPPTLTITESCKANTDAPFFKSGEASNPGCNIHLQGFGMSDECVIRHEDGTIDAKEPQWDADKLWGAWGINPQISLVNTFDKDLTVHTFDFGYDEWQVPMRVVVFESGTYTLDFTNLDALDVPCMKLEDTYSGIMYDVEEGSELTFTLSDTSWAPRFVLHLGKKYESLVTDNLCPGDSEGEISLDLNQTTVFYQLVSEGDTTGVLGAADPLLISGLEEGAYEVIVPGLDNLCAVTSFEFNVYDPSDLVAYEDIQYWTGSDDGSIELEVLGGTPGYSYLWSNGETTSSISDLGLGDYSVVITDANGCQISETYTIISGVSIAENEDLFEVYYDAQSNSLIFSDFNSEMTKLTIQNTVGQIVYEHQLSGLESAFSVQLPELAPAIYLLNGLGMNEGFKFVIAR